MQVFKLNILSETNPTPTLPNNGEGAKKPFFYFSDTLNLSLLILKLLFFAPKRHKNASDITKKTEERIINLAIVVNYCIKVFVPSPLLGRVRVGLILP